jgi:cystathionine beta-lyase/cystathionine gamma-synthase
VARFLEEHEKVRRVHWPGLTTHPDHAIARRQMSGFGGMVSFEVEGGAAGAERVHDRLRLFVRAASLGGVESLVSIPSRMSHRELDGPELERAGVAPGMLRLSVGLESPDELVADLREALA